MGVVAGRSWHVWVKYGRVNLLGISSALQLIAV